MYTRKHLIHLERTLIICVTKREDYKSALGDKERWNHDMRMKKRKKWGQTETSWCVKKKSDTETTTNEGKSGEDLAIKSRRDEGKMKDLLSVKKEARWKDNATSSNVIKEEKKMMPRNEETKALQQIPFKSLSSSSSFFVSSFSVISMCASVHSRRVLLTLAVSSWCGRRKSV